jgi:hypothetical protein
MSRLRYRPSKKRPRHGWRRVVSCCLSCEVCGRPLKCRPYFNTLYSHLCRACFETDARVAEGRQVS